MMAPNRSPCSHLKDYKRINGSDWYESLQRFFRTTSDRKRMLLRCSSCSNWYARIYTCLICSEICCSADAIIHSNSELGHDIAADLDRAELFCCKCNDQIYDSDFDAEFIENLFKRIPRVKSSISNGGSRKRNYNTRSRELLFSLDCVAKDSSNHPSGLRGLNNLGNTCFMNSVLQALFHTPPLRNYFLSDRHNRESCRQKRRRRGGTGETACFLCDLDGAITEIFSGDRTPYSPARFLHSWWKHSTHLASYEQQDAHEFFIAILDKMHEVEQAGVKTKGKECAGLVTEGTGACHCIAHQVFSGMLRSDVICAVCGATSTTYDPFVDISLTLEPRGNANVTSDEGLAGTEASKLSTLMHSLELFTKPEKLGSELYCENCQINQECLKQMSFWRIPSVICLHVKRFEHVLSKNTTRKLDGYLQFPFLLDMEPFLSSSIMRSRFGNRIFAFEGDESDNSASEFEVFAVITHYGKMESGHYVTYLRLDGLWYECDDAWITRVSEEVVRASQCYMLYYIQKASGC